MCNLVKFSNWKVFSNSREKKSFRANSPEPKKVISWASSDCLNINWNTTLKSNMTKDRLAALHAVSVTEISRINIRKKKLLSLMWNWRSFRQSIKNRASLIAFFLANRWVERGNAAARGRCEKMLENLDRALSIVKFLIEWCRGRWWVNEWINGESFTRESSSAESDWRC